MKCEWKDCNNKATKEYIRPAINHENSIEPSEDFFEFNAPLVIKVCDEHVEEAQKDHPVFTGDLYLDS